MLKRLLVPLDRSNLAEQSIGQAALIARGAKAVIELVLVHVPFPFTGDGGDLALDDFEWSAEHRYLEGVARDLQLGASIPVTHRVTRGTAADGICTRARDADLIVMTSHGRTGLSRAWLGSVADSVMRRTTVPVLLLRPAKGPQSHTAAPHAFRRILVPIDGSDLAVEALSPAIDLAKATGADLFLFRAVHPVPLVGLSDPAMPLAFQPLVADPDSTSRLTEEIKSELGVLARRIHDSHGIAVSFDAVADERSADAIVHFARAHEIDCIAMSTHGRGMSRLVIGSVADKVLRGSGLPVLLRRPVGVVDNYLRSDDVIEQLPTLAGTQ